MWWPGIGLNQKSFNRRREVPVELTQFPLLSAFPDLLIVFCDGTFINSTSFQNLLTTED